MKIRSLCSDSAKKLPAVGSLGDDDLVEMKICREIDSNIGTVKIIEDR